MIKIAILDDNQLYIDKVKELLAENLPDTKYTVFEYTSPDSFLDVIEKESFDIIFLDIVLGNKNGIEIGIELNKRQPMANVIFISINSEFFKDVYKVSHSYFLIKEFEKDRFADAINKAIKNIHRDVITIGSKTGRWKITLSEVLYFESQLKHTKMHLADGRVIEYNINLKAIEEFLPELEFVKTHQSFIVNMRYIDGYDRQNVFLSNSDKIPITRTYVEEAREKITYYFGGIT